MDGLLARDCSKMPCSEGYECSLAPYGNRVCCSLAECSSGHRARAICAAGCRKDETCEVIFRQRWCCPTVVVQKRCPDNRISNGAACSPSSPVCDDGYECEESVDQMGHLCCQSIEQPPSTITARARTFMKALIVTTVAPPAPLTFPTMPVTSPVIVFPSQFKSEPKCLSDSAPMMMDGEFLRCPQIGAPCPKAGYACEATIDGLYCCPMEIELQETTTLPSMTFPTIVPGNCIGCENKVSERPSPSCPYAFRVARHETRDEIKTCAGFLDFSCPFGFTCLPSSTTPTFLCCAQIST